MGCPRDGWASSGHQSRWKWWVLMHVSVFTSATFTVTTASDGQVSGHRGGSEVKWWFQCHALPLLPPVISCQWESTLLAHPYVRHQGWWRLQRRRMRVCVPPIVASVSAPCGQPSERWWQGNTHPPPPTALGIWCLGEHLPLFSGWAAPGSGFLWLTDFRMDPLINEYCFGFTSSISG